MIATNELRFVEREIGYSNTGNVTDFKTIRILQQKWHTDTYTVQEENCLRVMANVEWRDVPLAKEEA